MVDTTTRATSPERPPPRVLIVEDEPNIAIALRFLLERQNFLVECVDDGAAAIARLDATPPALLLLDVMLPSVNGFEVLKHVRASPRLNKVKVLMLTAKGQPQDRKIAEEIGADGFLTKPFDNSEVVALTRALAAREPSQR